MRQRSDPSRWWPNDLAAQRFGVEQDRGLLRQLAGGWGRSARQVSLNDNLRIGTHLGLKGPADQIDEVSFEWIEIEASLGARPSRRESTDLVVLGEEGPDIQVLYSTLAIDVMERGTLAQSHTQHAISIGRPARPTPKFLVSVLGRDLRQPIEHTWSYAIETSRRIATHGPIIATSCASATGDER